MKIDSVALTRAVRWIARKLIRLSTKSLKRGPHITRYYMYQHLREVLRAHNYSGKILSIGHSKELCKFFNLKNSVIVEANYPDYNILDLSFPIMNLIMSLVTRFWNISKVVLNKQLMRPTAC